MTDIPIDIVNASPEAQRHYLSMIAKGESERFSIMCALRSPPRIDTNDQFMEGYCNGKQFDGDELIGNLYKDKAKAAGVSTQGKVYLSGLAMSPGDPSAWVSDKGDALRVARDHNLDCEGMLKNKAVSYDPPEDKPYQVADSVVDAELAEAIHCTPGLDVAETRHEISETLSGR